MKKKVKKTVKKVLKTFGYQRNAAVKKPAEKKLPYEMTGEAWSDSTKPIAFMFGFNPWKREHTSKFFPEYRTAYVFGSATIERLKEYFSHEKDFVFIVWGYKEPEDILTYAKQQSVPLYRVEDGFVRSVGLGAAHTHPLSIIADSKTLYFDSREASDLEGILENTDFSADPELLVKAENCMNMLINMGVSKYNHTARTNVEDIYGPKTKKRILVIGQVEDDASIRYGCSRSITNNDLVRAAAEENPDAEIIYKPHPDVLGGFRKAYSNPMDVADISKVVVEPLSLVDSFQTIDHVYTITSLAGFEALMRGLKVTCFGAPFYSGWGLTDDRQPCERRTSRRSVAEVFAAAYLLYPKYLNPDTNELIELEEAILILKEMIAKNTFAQSQDMLKKKDIEGAEALIRQAIAQTANKELAFTWNIELVKVLKENKNYTEALNLIQTLFHAADDYKKEALLFFYRGTISYIQDDYKAAYGDLQKAASLHKNFNILNALIDITWELEGVSPQLLQLVDESAASSKNISHGTIKKYAAILCEAGKRIEASDLLKKHKVDAKAHSLNYLGLSVLESVNQGPEAEQTVYAQTLAQLRENENSFRKLIEDPSKTIAVAGSHVRAADGVMIDNRDLVIRIGEFSTDYPDRAAYGSKADVWFKPKRDAYAGDLLNKPSDLALIVVNENNPVYRMKNSVSHFTHYLERNKKVEVYPSVYYRELLSILGHAPSEEMMAVYWIYKIRGPLERTEVFGISLDDSGNQSEKNLYHSMFAENSVPLHV